jgi:hypothetical protein
MNTFLMLTATSLSLIAGVFYGERAKRHPESFWTYLIIGLVFTSPLMFGGYTWYDEFFTAGFLLANLPINIKLVKRTSHIIFTLFCGYMLFQAFTGIKFFSQFGLMQALTKIRWVFFVIIIFFVFVKSSSFKTSYVFEKDLPFKLTIAGLIFNLIYLSYGLIAIHSTGSTGFTQTAMISDAYREGTSPLLAIFGATGYVVAVYFVLIPASLMTIKNKTLTRSSLGWLTLALCFMTQMLYNSRSGIIIGLIFLGLFMLQHILNPRIIKGFIAFIPLIGLAILFQVFFNEIQIDVLYQDLFNTLHMGDMADTGTIDLHDIDRKIWNTSAILALNDNTSNALFGWGLRTSGYIVAPYVYNLFLGTLGTASYVEDVSTPGFAALAVDTGLVGLFLMSMILIFCLVEVYRAGQKGYLFILFVPIAYILQLFVMNIFDVLLFYLAIMPCGLSMVLARCNPGMHMSFNSHKQSVTIPNEKDSENL